MKTRFLLLFVLGMVSIVSFGQEQVKIPAFQKFKNYDTGLVFSVDSLPEKAGTIVFAFYDPGCGHCQELGYDISENWKLWSDTVQFYFVSMVEKDLVDAYKVRFGKNLVNKPNVSFIYDETGEFITLFDPQKFPSVFIYDAKTQRLIERFEGKSELDILKKNLSKIDKERI